MQLIIPTLKLGDSGQTVTNLQAALLALLDKKIIQGNTPNPPTEEDLKILSEKLKKEQFQEVYGEATRELVLIFQLQNGLGDNLNGVVEESTAKKLNEFLKDIGVFNNEADFMVRGRVTDNQGKPVAASVKAYDVDLHRVAPLGAETATNQEGYYEIAYTSEQFARSEKGSADILLRLFEPETNQEFQNITASDETGRAIETIVVPLEGHAERPMFVWFNAPNTATINFVLQREVRVLSEWEHIALTVSPLLESHPPHELNDFHQQFIQREANLDREQLQAWVLAAKAAHETALLTEDMLPQQIPWLNEIRAAYDQLTHAYLLEWIAFYGWFREGLDVQGKQLLQTLPDTLLNSLQNSGANNRIPDLRQSVLDNRNALDILRVALDQYRLALALEPAAAGETASVGDILNAVNPEWLNRELRFNLADVWNTLDPNNTDFVPQLNKIGMTPGEIPKLAQTIRLKNLTLNNASLINALQNIVPASPDSLSADASLNGLADIRSDRWLDLVYTHGTPSGNALSAEDYARQLEKETENLLPNASLIGKIQTGRLFVNNPAFSEGLVSILQQPGFNIITTDIDDYAEKQQLPDDMTINIKRLQHLKQVGVSWNNVEQFIDRGIDSIPKIANYGREQLHIVFGNTFSEEEINDIHDTAQTHYTVGTGMLSLFYPALFGTGIAVMEPQKPTDGQLSENATLRRLFGALEQCACDPCLSVLSPAAYFVDLLRYVDTSILASFTLKKRRPDLYDLELSCDNSNIELPHIDLVLEILENAVAFPKTITLSAGSDPVSQLQNNSIGAEIREDLQESAKEKLGTLQATPDKWSIRSMLLEPGVSYWVVSDRFRRWVLKAQKEAFGEEVLIALSQDMNLTKDEVSKLIDWMDNETDHFPIPTDSWNQAFIQMLLQRSSFNNTPLVTSVTQLTIQTLEPKRRWRVDYTVSGTLRIEQENGTKVFLVTTAAADGSQSQTNQYSEKGIQATIDALTQGRLGGIFSGYFNGNNTIDVVPLETDGWSYTQNLSSIEILYRPANLTIEALSYQSTANDRDLLVLPQNQNPLAYRELSSADAIFPWTLPYDQALTETRALLSKSGLSRLDLLETALPDSEQMSSDIWAREQLGLSEAQATMIVTAKSGDNLWRTWGLIPSTGNLWQVQDTFADITRNELPLDSNPNQGLLERVSIVLQQARIRFVELQALLATQFVSSGQSVSIDPIHECDPSKLWLIGLNGGILDRMHRFIRIWRILGWQIWEVDLVFSALGIGANDLNTENLRRIAQLHRLQQYLNLPIESLATCFGGFTDRVYSTIDSHEQLQPIAPLYHRIFQNKRLQNPPKPSLAFAATLPNLDDSLLSDIATALGLRPADLKRMIESRVLDLQGVVLNSQLPLNQNGLLQIWRNFNLAKLLKLALADYVAGSRMIGSTPFSSPASLLLFCREISFVRHSGVELSILERALTNQSTLGIRDPWMLAPEEAVTVFTGLQTELRSIRTPEAQPQRPLGITGGDLTSPPFTAPTSVTERWQRWGLKPVNGSTTQWTVASPYSSTATPPQPVPALIDTPLLLLQQAAVLGQQMGLTLAQLKELIQTHYVTPDQQSTTDLAITLNTAQQPILNGLSNTNIATYLDRIERFLALHRATGLPFRELDLMIMALGATNDLIKLVEQNAGAAILDIRDRLNLSLDTVIAWWGGLGGRQYLAHTAVSPTQSIVQPYQAAFERLFVNTNWQLNNTRTELVNPPSDWRSEIIALATAFAVEPNEIAYLLDTGIVPSQVNLTNLNLMHHWLTFAKANGITTRMLRYFRSRFTSLILTALPSPSALLQLMDQISAVKPQYDLVVQQVGRLTQLEPAIAGDFLLEKLTTPFNAVDRPAVEIFLHPQFLSTAFHAQNVTTTAAYEVLVKLSRLSWLNTIWKGDRSLLNWLKSSSSAQGFLGVTPNQLSLPIPYQQWKQSTLLFSAARLQPNLAIVLDDYRRKIGSGAARANVILARTVLAEAFGLTLGNVNRCAIWQLMDTQASLAIDPVNPDAQNDPIKLAGLIHLLATLQRLGLTASDLDALISQLTSAAVQIAHRILRSRFGESSWPDALREVNNTLRIEQRDRLVDYLLWKNKLKDADALYKYYLIDVQMSPCMRTTRLLQSIAAVQLFVQRCLMNLEKVVAPSSFDSKRWEWLQHYRVWEANRKVFLYPENWLYPELRDDRTETFKIFESELSQNQPSHETAVEAVRAYTDGLLDISQIVVMGMHEDISVRGKRTLYQVGRSLNSPYTYYWRKADGIGEVGTRWKGWERVEQELSQHHVVPFVYQGDLHIAWPLVAHRQVGQGSTLKDYFDVELAWIRHTAKGWTQRKKSQDKITVHKLFNRDEKNMFVLRVDEFDYGDNDVIRIELFLAEPRVASIQFEMIEELRVSTDASIPKHPSFAVIKCSLSAYEQYSDKDRRIAPSPAAQTNFWFSHLSPMGKGPASQFEGALNDVILTNLSDGTHWYKNSGGTFILGIRYPSNSATPAQHRFKVQAESRSPNISKNSPQSLSEYEAQYIETQTFTVERGKAYELKWNALFSVGTDPDQDNENTSLPLTMKRKGCFKLFGDRDGEWEEGNGRERPERVNSLTPPPNVSFSSSGLLETTQSSSPIELLDQIGLTLRSSSDRFFAVRASKSAALKKNPYRSWQIEEGGFKMLRNLFESGLTVANNKGYGLLLASYFEVSAIRSRANFDIANVFQLTLEAEFQQNSFGEDKLALYFPSKVSGNSGIDPRDSNLLPFDEAMPYALYNWEVFYHLPLMAATFLSKQHRYADARRWFHFVFDPTTNDISTGRERFWRFLPFRHNNQSPTTVQLLNTLADPNAPATDKQRVQDQINAWLADPFNPFAIARLRTSAFEWYTVITYIHNLINEGDQFFRQDTRESINEATLRYVLAADILGRRPEKISSRLNSTAVSYRTMEGRWDSFSNTWISLAPLAQAWIEYWKKWGGINPHAANQQIEELQKLASIGSTYFCVPPNDKIVELWDTVSDRLFKIRNCQNIDGITRNLPLLDPPIDPELLIRARAAGLEIAEVLNDRYAPLPIYRFQAQIQKATELCNEVKALGSALLSAIEKKEAERLSLLRSSHELVMLKLVEHIKQEQIAEANSNIEALNKTRKNSIDQCIYLQRQLGNNDVTFDENGVPIVGQSLITQVQGSLGFTTDEDGLGLIESEVNQLGWMNVANNYSLLATGAKIAGSVLKTAAAGAKADITGTAKEVMSFLGEAASLSGDGISQLGSNAKTWEQWSGLIAGWQRRHDDWVQQSKIKVEDIRQIDKQMTALEIRKAIAENELANHRQQMTHTREIDDYIRHQKFTGESLYTWMETQLSSVYFTAYQLAYEQAKRAERALRFELGDETTNFIRYGHWDGLRKGLLAGELLAQDMRRMEVSYLERNRRELEITKHISLRQLDPTALIDLRSKGECDIELPEWLFDLDFPGHHFRRIKTVSLTIPCIVGPYASVNGTLTLLSSKLRESNVVKGGSYAAVENYRASFLPVQAVATSTAQNDSGMFELNFRDERYLPFEYAGAVSLWRLKIPKDYAQFDFDTISDVILHMRYTARDGGEQLADSSRNWLAAHFGRSDHLSKPLTMMLSLKADFSKEWLQWSQSTANPKPTINVTLGREHLLYWMRAAGLKVADAPVSAFVLTRDEQTQKVTVGSSVDVGSGAGNLEISVLSAAIDTLLVFEVGR
jgi:Tc toxin complex TcA C-terminal TcB-binding domain/Neuraminidase-like domain